MKKFFSLVLFILAIAVFIFELYFSISGAIDVKNQLAEWEASGESGHALLGIPLDILVFGVVFLSAVGFIISLVSWKIARNRVFRIVSAVMYPLFLLMPIVIALILTV